MCNESWLDAFKSNRGWRRKQSTNNWVSLKKKMKFCNKKLYWSVRINPPQIRISEVRPREVHKRLLETVDGPERKRQKTDDTAPGPSGLQPIPEEPNNEYQAVRPRRQVNLQDFPMVQIEHINNIQKDTVPLRRLSLRGYSKITDTALQYIKNLDLEVLDLTYTNVSVKAIEDYLVEHPSCRIVHEQFCTCPTNLHF